MELQSGDPCCDQNQHQIDRQQRQHHGQAGKEQCPRHLAPPSLEQPVALPAGLAEPLALHHHGAEAKQEEEQQKRRQQGRSSI